MKNIVNILQTGLFICLAVAIQQSAFSQCEDETIIANSGTIGVSEADYVNNLNCYKTIQAPNGKLIVIHFTHFDVESDYDYLSVRDGSTGPLLEMCDGGFCNDAVSTGPEMELYFYTDYSITYTGWSAEFFTVDELYTADAGTIDMTGENYQSNTLKRILIKPDNGEPVTVNFTLFDIYEDDYFIAYDGLTTHASQIANCSGTPSCAEFTSTSGAVLIQFFALYANKTGWIANYVAGNVHTVNFDYDAAGNRTDRYVDVGDGLKSTQFKAEDAEEVFEDKLGEMNIFIYPNPNAGEMILKLENLPKETNARVTIYDSNGKTVYIKQNLTSEQYIDISDSPNGMYILKIIAGDNAKEIKVIKK